MGGVPQHPAHQPHIRPTGVTSMAVFQLEQGFDVEFELPLVGDVFRHLRVEPVQAVDQDDFFFTEFHWSMLGDAFARLEVIIRNTHFATFKELYQILVDELHVERLGSLKIVIPEFIFGVHFEVVEVVVDVQSDELESEFREMLANFYRRGGLAAGRRTRHENHPDLIAPVEDHIGGVFNVFVVGSLGGCHNLVQAVMPDGFVQQLNRVNVVRASPVQCLPKFGPGNVPGRHTVTIRAFFPLARAFFAVKDVSLGNLGASILDQYFFDHILNLLNVRHLPLRSVCFQLGNDLGGKRLRGRAIASAHRHRGAVDGVGDALGGKGHHRSISFDHMGKFCHKNLHRNPYAGSLLLKL